MTDARVPTTNHFVMNPETHLICESVQEVTLIAWPYLCGHYNPFDLDSRDVLATLRDWGKEFENWWMSHDEDWRDRNDYITEVDRFTFRKLITELQENILPTMSNQWLASFARKSFGKLLDSDIAGLIRGDLDVEHRNKLILELCRAMCEEG